jgi:hypothetical protein
VDVGAPAIAVFRDGDKERECWEESDGDVARCFPLSVVKLGPAEAPCPFARQPPASRQCRQHIRRLHLGWSRVDLHRFLPGFAHVVRLDVVLRVEGGASWVGRGRVAGCADVGADRVGEEGGDEEANRDVGGDSLSSAHLKNEQLVPLLCFL